MPGIISSCLQEDGSDRRSQRADKEQLFDVEEYLTGVLWNLQMYIDGFVPNYYWRYSRRYSPSVADILVWIQHSSPESLAKVSPPVTRAPPLPAAIACLCMIPLTESGRAFLPERLQPLVRPGSPLLGSLEWHGVTLNIPKILRIVQEEAPDELRDFHDGSQSRYGFERLGCTAYRLGDESARRMRTRNDVSPTIIVYCAASYFVFLCAA